MVVCAWQLLRWDVFNVKLQGIELQGLHDVVFVFDIAKACNVCHWCDTMTSADILSRCLIRTQQL